MTEPIAAERNLRVLIEFFVERGLSEDLAADLVEDLVGSYLGRITGVFGPQPTEMIEGHISTYLQVLVNDLTERAS